MGDRNLMAGLVRGECPICHGPCLEHDGETTARDGDRLRDALRERGVDTAAPIVINPADTPIAAPAALIGGRSVCEQCGGEVEHDGIHVSEWSPCVVGEEAATDEVRQVVRLNAENALGKWGLWAYDAAGPMRNVAELERLCDELAHQLRQVLDQLGVHREQDGQ